MMMTLIDNNDDNNRVMKLSSNISSLISLTHTYVHSSLPLLQNSATSVVRIRKIYEQFLHVLTNLFDNSIDDKFEFSPTILLE